MDLWIANEAAIQQSLTPDITNQPPIEKVLQSASDKDVAEPDLLLKTNLEVKPFVLEGSVNNFDPVKRAAGLVNTFPRKWCGLYRSFEDDSNVDVIINFSGIKSIGKILELRGEMFIDDVKTPIRGYLNAKSDQLEILLNSNNRIPGLEDGGSFLGLQGTRLLAWNSPRLTHSGGRLELRKQCINQLSKAPAVISIW